MHLHALAWQAAGFYAQIHVIFWDSVPYHTFSPNLIGWFQKKTFKLLRMIANCPAEKVHWCPAVASCIHADENCIHADENCIHADENCITLWSKWIFFFLVQQLKLQLLPPIYTGKKMLFYMGVPSVKNKQLFSIKEMVG